jgi:hypothetical protein
MSTEETLPAGTYYVGDLCYVMGEKNGFNWGEVLDDMGQDPGVAEYKGTRVFSSYTEYGDGQYADGQKRKYSVDSGTIGCIPVRALGENPYLADGHAHVIEFPEDFTCETCEDGVITIGHVRIQTGDEDY